MSQEIIQLHIGDPAPEFRLTTPDDQGWTLARAREGGHKVALFFFRGTW